ncbi:hypothetical protein FCR2A7T_03870 [Flavobacterium cauense R2A-7]|nr:hypothetical protein FCR2A7T_03870 [Flavobacterium cauense R2A-7]
MFSGDDTKIGRNIERKSCFRLLICNIIVLIYYAFAYYAVFLHKTMLLL